ncbi:MAG: oligosaccharide flippase family protein [Campylobacterota bacterium]|nr:oligosaccharide flippase family protein [Campylobacterota bacterium]
MLSKLKPKSEFSRNVLTLMTGTTIAQAIPFALSPIITRIYSPEDFGMFALYFSILGLVGVIATARYEIAIVLPKTDEDAINILALSLSITIFLTLLVSILIFFFKDSVLDLFNATDIGSLLYLMPLSLLLVGFYNSFNYWSNRKKRFKNISNSRVIQSLGTGSGQIGFGTSGIFGGMILGNIIGSIFSTTILIKKFIQNDTLLIKNIDKNKAIEQMKIYKDFPLVNSFHVFSDVAKTSLSVMLISAYFGSAVLGFYALSIRVLQAPLGIIGSSFGQVLYQRFNTAKENNETIYDIAKNVMIKLILFALPIFITLYFISPELFAFVFGEKWRVAGEYTQILLPYLFMNFLISPISQIPIILNKQKQFFYIALVGNIGMPLIIFICFKLNYSITNSLLVITFFFTIYYSLIIIWILNLTKKDRNEV